MCSDVTLKSGAGCNTDHHSACLCENDMEGLKKRAGMNEGKRYDV